MLCGLLAGLCAIAFAKAVAEPQIARAEHFEQQLDAQLGRPAEQLLVARDVQNTVGLGVGVAIAGVALGGLFGMAFAAVYRRWSHAAANPTAAGLALTGFVAVFLVPFLKYPANPPSVGNPDTLGRRTALYFLAVAVGLLAVALAGIVRRRSLARFGSWNASILAAAVFAVAVGAAYVTMPGINEVPAGFPATLLWRFRLASAGTDAVLWAALGLAFGAFTQRAESRATAPAPT